MADNKTIFQTVNELETSEHFNKLVDYANNQASNFEKAIIYFSIVETFAKILELEFENKNRIEGQKIQSGFRQFNSTFSKKPSKKIVEKENSDIAGWDEIANKLNQYLPYRNIIAHNILIDKENRKVRTIDEINHIVFMAGELAEEIYNLIIGAREYLEFEYDEHIKNPDL